MAQKSVHDVVALNNYSLGNLWGDSLSQRCINIFINNILVASRCIILGVVPFLFLSVAPIILSSFPLGLLLAWRGYENQFSFIVQRFLPHGMFELLAISYAGGLGFFLTKKVSRCLLKMNATDNLTLRKLLVQLARSFLIIVTPLLAIAALIEVYIKFY